MAFSKGNQTNNAESTTGNNFARYTGVAPFKVISINPTAKEMSDIYGREIENEPEYIKNKDGVDQAEIKFILEYAGDDEKIQMKDRIMYFISNKVKYSNDGLKIQVINAYGESSYIPVDNAKSGKMPENMSWFPTKGMRPAFVGEVDFTNFIKAFLSIPDRMRPKKNDDGSWSRVEIDKPEDAECQFEAAEIKELLKGNIKCVKDAIGINPDNRVKLVCGVKSTDDNKLYQQFAKEFPMRFATKKYDYTMKQIKEKQDNGSYPNVDFGKTTDFKQYELKATDFVKQDASEDVWGGAQEPAKEVRQEVNAWPVNKDDLPF